MERRQEGKTVKSNSRRFKDNTDSDSFNNQRFLKISGSKLHTKLGDKMFGYHCQECGKGIVKPTKVRNYPTKFAGYPFIVPEAIIGICELCGAKYFNASERKRWKKLFQKSLESQGELLTPQEIRSLRKQLGLEMKDFALLIGCTLQSLSNWENPSRRKPQPRIADLMMRLLRASLQKGEIDVLKFLLFHVKKMNVELKIHSPVFSNGFDTLRTQPKGSENIEV